MAFYAGRVVLHPAMENPTLIVITGISPPWSSSSNGARFRYYEGGTEKWANLSGDEVRPMALGKLDETILQVQRLKKELRCGKR